MIQERIDKAVSMVDVIMKKAFKGTSIGENTGASCMIWYACSEGEPERAWKDCDGYLCIRYESGRWWHYRWEADGHLVWW